MADELIMDMAALNAGAEHIRAASEVADTVHGQALVLQALSHAAGQSDAVGGLSHFFDRWSYGAGHLHTDADQLAKALTMSVNAIRQLDQEMAASLEKKASKGQR